MSWNCNMGYRAKQKDILELHPDLVVLQECSERDILQSGAPFAQWVGNNPHKGLGVLGYGDHTYTPSATYSPAFPWFLPFRMEDEELTVLGAWASVRQKQERYVRISHQAIDYYRPFLTADRAVAIGDFNSNSIWDKASPGSSHSALVAKLEGLHLRSVYHAKTGQAQGQEKVATFYLYRHRDKGYHIDYAFVSHSMLDRAELTILGPDVWLRHSDHLPLVLDLHL